MPKDEPATLIKPLWSSSITVCPKVLIVVSVF
jgi:hypothetical protein